MERKALLNELPKGAEIKIGEKWPIQIHAFDIEFGRREASMDYENNEHLCERAASALEAVV